MGVVGAMVVEFFRGPSRGATCDLVQLEGALPSVCFRADICMVNRSSDFLVVVGGMCLHLR